MSNEQKTIGVFVVETPVHCGTGQDIGVVDQPIQREKHTNYPRIQGSEIKGVFRQYYRNSKGENINEIFGPEGEKGDGTGGDFASAVSFGDARVLFFPVKSLKGVYVWITCKDVLDRFSRTLKLAGNTAAQVPDVSVDKENIIIYDNSLSVGNDVVLEEYKFTKTLGTANEFDSIIKAIIPDSINEYKYLNESLKKKVCVVSDEIFGDFVEMSTEVITRIKIDEKTGVVKKGALWTEEYLPTDTILYFPVFAYDTKDPEKTLTAENVLPKIRSLNSYIQIGGNETVGKGFVKINWIS